MRHRKRQDLPRKLEVRVEELVSLLRVTKKWNCDREWEIELRKIFLRMENDSIEFWWQ